MTNKGCLQKEQYMKSYKIIKNESLNEILMESIKSTGLVYKLIYEPCEQDDMEIYRKVQYIFIWKVELRYFTGHHDNADLNIYV